MSREFVSFEELDKQYIDRLERLKEENYFDKPETIIIKPDKSLLDKATEFIKTVTGSRVDDAEFQRRLAICIKCPVMKEVDKKRYCGACGCPSWYLAELNQKLRFKEVKCPKGNF
jgi:hypothetical protein